MICCARLVGQYMSDISIQMAIHSTFDVISRLKYTHLSSPIFSWVKKVSPQRKQHNTSTNVLTQLSCLTAPITGYIGRDRAVIIAGSTEV